MGEGCLRFSLYLSPRVLDVSPIYSSPQAMSLPLITVYYPTLLILGVLVFWLHEDLFNCCVALEVSLYSTLTANLLEAFCYAFCERNDLNSCIGFLSSEDFFCACILIAGVLWGCIVVPALIPYFHCGWSCCLSNYCYCCYPPNCY